MARILTVTPHPAVDITYTVDRQVVGETVRVRDVRRRAGGKGVNVARVALALGHDVTAFHPLGGDSGRWMERALRLDGVPALTCPVGAETRTTIAVVDGIAHPTLLTEPGDALTAAEWDALVDTVTAAVTPGDWVVVAGSFPPSTDAERVHALVSALAERRAHVLVDTSGPPLVAAADAGADIVKGNAQEVREALSGAADAVERLGRAGSRVLVSRGADGLLLREPDGARYEQEAVPGISGNPTGAGDAATAGLVAALTAGHGPRAGLAWAAVLGAAAVLHPLAGAVDLALIPELCARIGLPPALSPLPAEPEQESP